jgi:hypothetical protein
MPLESTRVFSSRVNRHATFSTHRSRSATPGYGKRKNTATGALAADFLSTRPPVDFDVEISPRLPAEIPGSLKWPADDPLDPLENPWLAGSQACSPPLAPGISRKFRTSDPDSTRRDSSRGIAGDSRRLDWNFFRLHTVIVGATAARSPSSRESLLANVRP